jgi:hypothetical protein
MSIIENVYEGDKPFEATKSNIENLLLKTYFDGIGKSFVIKRLPPVWKSHRRKKSDLAAELMTRYAKLKKPRCWNYPQLTAICFHTNA